MTCKLLDDVEKSNNRMIECFGLNNDETSVFAAVIYVF